MAEPKKQPAKKPTDKKTEPKKGSSIVVNIIITVVVLTTIALGVLLATRKVRLAFLFEDIGGLTKRSTPVSDTLTTADTTTVENADFEIKPEGYSGSPDGRKYVIAGVFYNKDLCDKQAARFNAKGLSTDLIPFTTSGGNTLYRISIFVADDVESAIAKRDEVQQNYGIDCWVLK